MAQIIPDVNGIGSVLGSSLGTGLGTALQSLAQNKLQNLLQRQQAGRIAPGLAALGIPEQEAQQIAMLPESIQSVVLKNYLQAAENQGLDQALKQLSGEELPTQSSLPLEMLSEAPVQNTKNSPSAESARFVLNATQGQKTPETAPRSLGDILKSPRLTPEHKLKVASLEQQKQFHKEKLSAKEQQEIDKETKPYYDEISKAAKGAKESDIRLDRMQELVNRGNLTNPGWVSLVDTIGKGVFGFGIDLSWALHPDTQEFKKLSADFLKNAKDYFGNRLTDADLKAFLQTIPNASQSNEAKIRVIQNLKAFNKISLLKKKAADDIIKQNGGKRPRNLDQLVDEATGSEVDKIAQDFKKNLNI